MEQTEKIIGALKRIVENMKQGMVSAETLNDVEVIVKELNKYLYHVETLNFQKEYTLEKQDEYQAYIEELERLIEIWQQSFTYRGLNTVDAEFWELYDFFKYADTETIYRMVVMRFLSLPEEQREKFKTINKEYPFLQTKIDGTQNDYSLIRQHVETLVAQIEKFRWLYEHLEDYRSKIVFNGILRYWFEFNEKRLHALNEAVYVDYFDMDIIPCRDDMVVVDLGAYVGEDVLNFIKIYKKYKRIYAYEITPSTYGALCNNVSECQDVIPVNKGVSKAAGKMYITGCDYGGANKLSEEVKAGGVQVDVVALDDDIREPVDVIKMDIEGAEKDAILGAERHIKDEKPTLAISAYHFPGDIVEIPELIHSIRDDYKFYLRYNGKKSLWPCDYVLFAK